MDAEELRKKLYEVKDGPASAMSVQSEKKKKLVYSSIAVVIVVIIILGLWSMFTAPSKQEVLAKPEACFKTGECLELIFADTPQAQEIGYSNYTEYPAGRAMMFPMADAPSQAMWMKDMKFSVDILWVDGRDKISYLVKSAPPCTGSPCLIYEPEMPASYVLEVPSGFSMLNNLFIGDAITLKDMKGR